MPHQQEALEAKILQNVNTVLATGQRTTLKQISRQADLVEDLQFDSLDLAELSVRLEAEFGVNVFVGKIPSTVNDIIHRLESAPHKES